MTIGDDAPPASRQHLIDLDRTVAEQADQHAITLESLLAILRSPRLGDDAARTMARETATSALIALRTHTDRQLEPILEPVVGAFARLRNDLRPLERFSDLDIQFIEPPVTGRALPGEVAHAGRAIVRSAILALVNGADARRMRVQWDCDGLHLLINIRDDGDGTLTAHDESLRPITERVSSLDGALSVSSTPDWGSAIEIRLPLDPPVEPPSFGAQLGLTSRERDVLRLLVAGARNRMIAAELGISDNTVKFHVANVLRKTGAHTRAEVVGRALGR